MGLKSWLVNRLLGEPTPTSIEAEEMFSLEAEVAIRNLAFFTAVNLYCKLISKCEFKTYLNGKEVKGDEYYLWNIEPNQNQNSTQFITKLITKLFTDNEALVIEQGGKLFVADSFQQTEYALLPNTFSNIAIGDFTFNRKFAMDEVLYFKLNNSNIRSVINAIFESYGKLIECGKSSYSKARGEKGILEVEAVAQNAKNFQETFETLMNKRFKKYFKSDNAVLPLFEGYKYNSNQSKTYQSESSRDIKAMYDDIFDFTARALNIPPVMLKGDVANISKDVINNLLTIGVDPLCDNLQEEINRKRNGKEGFIKGTKLKIDTRTIKHIDLFESATAIDKLIASGGFCINDIRTSTGEEIIDKPWAWKHYMTKNYATMDVVANELEEGGNGSAEETMGN